MAIDPTQLDVSHNAEEKRFEVIIDGKKAFTQYMMGDNGIAFVHTEVPEEFEGMGVGSKIAFTALEYAKAHNLRVQAICPFIAAYVRRHPEYQSITVGY